MPSTPQATLSAEQRRQSLYASLLQYAPEAGELRERALDRLVMGALIGSSVDSPYRVGAIAGNLRFGAASAELRTEVVQEALARLAGAAKVAMVEVRKRHAYYLLPAGLKEIGDATASAEQLFKSVVERMLQNTAHLVPAATGSLVVRRFISECFARFGRRIAKVVIGQATRDDLVPEAEARLAFDAACREVTVSAEARESLQQRCLGFLKSKHQDDERLKFNLTQGYYFTQLIGLDNLPFNPLAEDAFKESVFYVDANILIPRLLSDDLASTYDELITQAKRIGVQLVVTRATINEIRTVAADRERRLAQLLPKLPDDVAELSRDQFLTCYLDAREKNPTLTLREFMAPFDHVTEIVQQQLGLEVDERLEDDILRGRDFQHVATVMQEDTVEVRRFKKQEDVLRHDVAMYVLVSEEREDSPKTWFLTRDRALLRASIRLADGHVPFCFSLLGFLQSISPFLKVGSGENPLVDAFSAFLSEQVFPAEPMFELQELQLLAELHEDVLSTPHDQLIQALDYVKRNVLHGQQFTRDNAGKFSLGLKKFLSSSAEDRAKELLADRERLAQEADAKAKALEEERLRRETAEGRAEHLGGEVDELNIKLTTVQTVAGHREKEIAEVRAAVAAENLRRARARMIQGFLGGAACWLFVSQLSQLVIGRFPALASFQGGVEAVIAVVGTALFVLPALPFVEQTRWTNEVKIAFLGLIITIGAAFSRLFDAQTWSNWSAYIQAGLFVSALLVYFIRRRETPAG